MSALMVSKVKLSDLLNQVFDSLQAQFLEIFKITLESELERLRNEIVVTRRYYRGNVLKRWGYTRRKWIHTTLGVLQDVRMPRIRSHGREVSLFCDRYVKRAGMINALFIEMFLWGMSSRRVSVLSKKLYRCGLTASSICRLKRLVLERVSAWRERPIGADIQIVVADGIYGRYRGRGTGVCLLAMGVDSGGKVHMLDWQACESESAANWRRLFRRLKQRGLKQVRLVVTDHGSAVPEAILNVWGQHCQQQLCLWHFSRELDRMLRCLNSQNQERFYRDYWKIFDSPDIQQAHKRWHNMNSCWAKKAPQAMEHLQAHWPKLIAFYAYPPLWRQRIRTTNLAEGFFAQLQKLLIRFPGWIDEKHITQIVGLFILGTKLYHHNRDTFYHHGIPENILTINFNRIT